MAWPEGSSSGTGGGTSTVLQDTISHAYIQYPPLRFDVPGASGVMFDDGNKQLLVPTPDKVYTWAVGRSDAIEPLEISVPNGPVMALRFSLDGRTLAMQRSDQEVELFDTVTKVSVWQTCKKKADRILGFFWSDCPGIDLVLVTSGGLELYALSPSRKALRLVDARRQEVSWYVYTHESRLVLLASGPQCQLLSGYQFSAGGVVKLPKFEVTLGRSVGGRRAVLAPEDIHIAVMYGRLYAFQRDANAGLLRAYRFYRDAVVAQAPYSLYAPEASLSVVDSALLIHNPDAGVVLLYDVLAVSQQPVVSPLPLTLRGVSEADRRMELYTGGWVFLTPDMILDHARGYLWKIRLDLPAIVSTCSDSCSALAFLQRRRSDPDKARALSLEALSALLQARAPMYQWATAMDVVSLAYSAAVRQSSNLPRQPAAEPRPRNTPPQAPPRTLSPSPLTMQPQQPEDKDGSGASMQQDPDSGEELTSVRNERSDPQAVENETRPQEEPESGEELAFVRTKQEDEGTQELKELDRQSDQEQNHEAQNLPGPDSESELFHVKSSDRSAEGYEAGWGWQGDMPRGEIPPQPGVEEPRGLGAEVPGGERAEEGPAWRALTPAISPEELFSKVLSPLEAVWKSDTAYMVAGVIEFLRSAAAVGSTVPPPLYTLLLKTLATHPDSTQLLHLLQHKVIEPSVSIAQQVLALPNVSLQVRSHALGMLKGLRAHKEYARALASEGRLAEALRYMRRHRIPDAITPSSALQAAASTKQAQQMGAVLRFFLESVEGFDTTIEYTNARDELQSLCISEGCGARDLGSVH